ncbi:hypothetical protein SSX86_007468 [Deinandra increscens subsp. villosa]|uniref:F-box domain-containing protein n=1 Tax=Deinandra increscens subsp. villosa TaxID=3103831 RepID=A0AAP0DHE7_9ASTR
MPTRNWLALPSDLMANILQRIGVIDVLENAQKVCTTWREICKDPAMWTVIYMEKNAAPSELCAYLEMCKDAVDRSQGRLLDFTILGFCDHELLRYAVDRSSKLRRLEILFSSVHMYGIWREAFKKLPFLEELSLADISPEDIEAARCYCPLLKTLKVNKTIEFRNMEAEEESMATQNELPLAIGKNLPRLTHLELLGNNMNNFGLQAILDGCCHLESLDLRGCLYVDLNGDLGKRCSQQIKDLKLPRDSLEEGYLDSMETCVYRAYDYDGSTNFREHE